MPELDLLLRGGTVLEGVDNTETPDIAVGAPDEQDRTVPGAAIGQALGLRANPMAAVSATRNKLAMRDALGRAGVLQPEFAAFGVEEDPAVVAMGVSYPCVLKPLVLSASRGVIRADTPAELAAAWARIAAILLLPEIRELGDGASKILVESFVPGIEVALEGMLTAGQLQTLALFDKPDPLDGSYFEETIYMTPSRLPEARQSAVAD